MCSEGTEYVHPIAFRCGQVTGKKGKAAWVWIGDQVVDDSFL